MNTKEAIYQKTLAIFDLKLNHLDDNSKSQEAPGTEEIDVNFVEVQN